MIKEPLGSQPQAIDHVVADNDEPSLGEFFNNEELSDVILIDDSDGMKRKFFAHKVILSSKSSFFRKLLRADPTLKEATLPTAQNVDYQALSSDININQASRIPVIYGMEVDIIQTALRFLYSDYDFSVLMNGGLNTQTCLRFFACFHVLQVSSGLFLVERFILQYFMSAENCLEVLKVGLQFDNTSFVENAVRAAAERLGKLLKTSDGLFYNYLLRMPYQGFLKIISSADLQVDNEDIVLSLVHDYIAYSNENAAVKKAQVEATANKSNEQPQQGQQQQQQPQIGEDKPNEESKQQQGEEQGEMPKDNNINELPQPNETQLNSGENKPLVESNQENKESKPEIPQENTKISTFGGVDDDQVKELLLNIRLGYVSHSVLTYYSEKPSFLSQKELFFQAISLKLSQYEQNTSPNFQTLNSNPRESYHHKVSSLNPAMTETQLNIAKSGKSENNKNYYNPSLMQSSLKGLPNSNLLAKSSFQATPNQQGLLAMSEKALPVSQSNSITFTYSSDFDENGLLYFLGSRNKTTEFSNPFYLNEVMPFCSSVKSGRIEDLTGRLPANTISTDNEKNSFFGIDLGEDRFFFPTCYTLRNRSAPFGILYNWVIEGSNDNKLWHVIDKRVHFSKDSTYNLLLEKEREILRKPSKSSTWGIDTTKLKATLKSIGIDVLGFRVFRITQLSTNGNNTYEFAIGAIEFYGKGYGMNWEI